MPGNAVHIRCDGCGARFRFDRDLIAGYQGARFRCRRCGRPIDASAPGVTPPLRETAAAGNRVDLQKPLPFPNADPPPAGGMEPAAARPVRSGPAAVPVAREAPAGEPVPDNLVVFQRIRETQRVPRATDTRDTSDRISRYILASVPVYPEDEPGILPEGAMADRVVTGDPPAGRTGILGGTFRWGDPGPPARRSFTRKLLLFAIFGTAIAGIGFSLILYFAH